MSFHFRIIAGLLASLFLVACGRQQEQGEQIAGVDGPDVPAPSRATPNFGSMEVVSREAEGIGSTPELAVLSALQSAISQVNGVHTASNLHSVREHLSASLSGYHAGSIDSDALVQQIVSASRGAVLGYEIVSQEEITKLDVETIGRVRASDEGYTYSGSGSVNADARASVRSGSGGASASTSYKEEGQVDARRGASSYESDLTTKQMKSYWKVRVRAEVPKYHAPDEQGRPKIVVSSPRVLSNSYVVGDDRIPSGTVARAIGSRLSDILVQTKRFIVLDREFDDELQGEIDRINSGNVRPADAARLGQQLATDLIVIPTVERFEYPRTSRQLRMSDRQVSSYSGGGRISLKVLNATTGEVVMSDSFDYVPASLGPSTLPRSVDGESVAAAMMEVLSTQIGPAVVTSIFPVSVVAIDGGQVILSQGGDMLKEGDRYQAVRLGSELKDPQTGRSLGRSEQPCCTVRIDRVAVQTSYGTIEGGEPVALDFTPGSIELRGRLKPAKGGLEVVADAGSSAPKAAAAEPKVVVPAKPVEDPDW